MDNNVAPSATPASPGISDEELAKAVQARRMLIAQTIKQQVIGSIGAEGVDPAMQAANDQEEAMFANKFGTNAPNAKPGMNGIGAEDIGGTIGGIAGGMAGAPLGAPGMIAGSVVGSMLGGAAGEAARQAYVDDDPFHTPAILRSSIRQGTYDLIGSTVGLGATVGRAAVKRFIQGKPIMAAIEASGRLSKLAREVAPEIAKKHGDDVARVVGESFAQLDQVVTSRLLKKSKEAAGSSVFAKEIPEHMAAQETAAQAVVEHIEKKVGPLLDKADVARHVVDSWKGQHEAIKRGLGDVYDDIATRMDTRLVPIEKFGPGSKKAFITHGGRGVTRVVKENGTTAGMVNFRNLEAPLGQAQKILKELEETGKHIPEVAEVRGVVGQLPAGDISFSLAQRLRTHIANLEDKLTFDTIGQGGGFGGARKKPAQVRELEMVRAEITSRMEDAVKAFDATLPPGKDPVFPIWKAADEDWGFTHDTFANAELQGWIRAADSHLAGTDVIDQILKPQEIERTRHVVKSLSGELPLKSRGMKAIQDYTSRGKEELRMVRRWHLDSLRKAVTNKETGAFHPGQYLEKLRTEFGTANAKALHGPGVVDDLIQVGKDLKLFRDQPGAGGSFAMTLAETGPILSFFTGGGVGLVAGGATGAAAGAAGALATLAVTVKGFNKWLSNPKRVKDVLTVAKTRARSGKATAATLRLLHALSTEDIVNNESGNRMTLEEVSRRNAGRRAIQQEVGQ